ncbi:MAG: DUF952 domain-containing protein [Bacteroidetes bacterium]|jgi:uncharacterized protein (DUF952 family)|nr:DUF952 domain-containing protein [Bacteroidota bacterium]
MIYHITTKQEWRKAIAEGFYTAASLDTEGFIHCSEEQQVKGVLERYYKGVNGLLKLVIDETKVTHKIIYETAPSVHQNFPHIYGVLNVDAVVDIVEIN